jgi:hypothetical protein
MHLIFPKKFNIKMKIAVFQAASTKIKAADFSEMSIQAGSFKPNVPWSSMTKGLT